MNQIRIRGATLEDSPAVARLMTQLGYETSADEMRVRLAGILHHDDYMTYVAEWAGEVVGVVGAGVGNYYEKNGTYGRLLALVVDERHRGRGVGASLVAEAELWLKGLGASTVVVNSGSQRSEAHCFYKRLGYSKTGLRFVKALP